MTVLNIMRLNLKRALSWRFLLSVFLIYAAGAVALKVNFRYYPGAEKAGGLTVFLYATALSLGGIFQSVSPLAAVFPYSLSYAEDLNSGNLHYQMIRVSFRKIALARILTVALVSGAVFLIAYALMLFTAVIVFPGPAYRIDLTPLIAFKKVYDRSLIDFILIYCLHSFCFGVSYGLLGLGVSSITRRKIWGVLVPTLLYHGGVLIAWLFPKFVIYDVVRWIPYDSLSILSKTEGKIWYSHLLIALIGIGLFLFENIRYRRNTK